jgi:hypothetical protein
MKHKQMIAERDARIEKLERGNRGIWIWFIVVVFVAALRIFTPFFEPRPVIEERFYRLEFPESTTLEDLEGELSVVDLEDLDIIETSGFTESENTEPSGVEMAPDNPNFIGEYGVLEGDTLYDYARAPALPGEYRITCYSPVEGFHLTNQVCRGGTVQEWVTRAEEMGLDGICAAGGQTPWYDAAKHADPPITLEIEGHGRYLLVDRAARRLDIIDIWVPNLDVMWNHYRRVTPIY